MKFNITSLTCLPKPNTLFLSAVVTSVPFQLSSISTLPNTSFNFYLNPWFKQSTKPLQVFKFNSLKIKQTFKLLSLQNNCYYVNKKKHNISTLFIRSNLSLKIQTVNYSKLAPTISKLLKLFLTCNISLWLIFQYKFSNDASQDFLLIFGNFFNFSFRLQKLESSLPIRYLE